MRTRVRFCYGKIFCCKKLYLFWSWILGYNSYWLSGHCCGLSQRWCLCGVLNSSTPGQNGRHILDDIFKCIFMNEKFCILIQIPLKCVSKGPIGNDSVLVQVMAWHQIGDKPFPELVLIQFTEAYMRSSWELSSHNLYKQSACWFMVLVIYRWQIHYKIISILDKVEHWV